MEPIVDEEFYKIMANIKSGVKKSLNNLPTVMDSFFKNYYPRDFYKGTLEPVSGKNKLYTILDVSKLLDNPNNKESLQKSLTKYNRVLLFDTLDLPKTLKKKKFYHPNAVPLVLEFSYGKNKLFKEKFDGAAEKKPIPSNNIMSFMLKDDFYTYICPDISMLKLENLYSIVKHSGGDIALEKIDKTNFDMVYKEIGFSSLEPNDLQAIFDKIKKMESKK